MVLGCPAEERLAEVPALVECVLERAEITNRRLWAVLSAEVEKKDGQQKSIGETGPTLEKSGETLL